MTEELFGLNNPLPTDPHEAAKEIDKIFANRKHPYHHPAIYHPLKRQAEIRVTRLFEIYRGQAYNNKRLGEAKQ